MREKDVERFVNQSSVVHGKRKGQPLSENTKRVYQTSINHFYRWMQEEGFEDWFEIRPSDIGAYVAQKRENGSSNSDIDNTVGAVKRFYDFLRQDYPEKDNPVERHLKFNTYGGKSLREKQGHKKGVSSENYQLLLDHVQAPHKERDKLMFRFLGEMGLRRTELAELKLQDIDMDTHRVSISNVKSSERDIPFPRSMKRDIRRWIDGGQRDSYMYAPESDKLFLSTQSGSITGQSINRRVRKAADSAGIQDTWKDAAGDTRRRVTAHQLRHHFGQQQFDKDNMSLKALSEYMGHSSVDVTADVYGDMDKDQVFDMIDKQFD